MNRQHPLDDPVRSSLLGAHARFLQRYGAVLRYPADVAPFATLAGDHDGSVWADVAALFGPGGVMLFAGIAVSPPGDWEVVLDMPGVQMVGHAVAARADPEAIRLGATDVPEMLELVARTQPGPFLPRTIQMGSYLGIRHRGALIAMAGERLRPAGFTEISAVCTDPGHRGRGLATRLIRAVAAGVRQRGEIPFLHASAANTDAIQLYASLGFRLRRRVTFLVTRVPEPDTATAMRGTAS